MKKFLDMLKFDERGLIPAIIQDSSSGEILMLAYMNRESIRRTLESGQTCFWSRSRREYWVKGATSGNTQHVEDVRFDCDADTLLFRVRQNGAACHTGKRSCFYRRVRKNGRIIIEEIPLTAPPV